MRREDSEAGRTLMELSVDGRRGSRRSKKKRLNVIEYDMRTTVVCVNDVRDWIKCRLRTNVANTEWL